MLCTHWANGSKGTEELAQRSSRLPRAVLAKFAPIYPDDMPLLQKIETIAKTFIAPRHRSPTARCARSSRAGKQMGYGHLPVCMAKTQYSFSTDPNLRGAPTGHTVPVREVRLSAGAGFIVVITGEIMTMPGLPRVPSSEKIFLNADGFIEGLF
jgi:formate--tetrahydrofolate ligase